LIDLALTFARIVHSLLQFHGIQRGEEWHTSRLLVGFVKPLPVVEEPKEQVQVCQLLDECGKISVRGFNRLERHIVPDGC
jgi:hypothetical protein